MSESGKVQNARISKSIRIRRKLHGFTSQFNCGTGDGPQWDLWTIIICLVILQAASTTTTATRTTDGKSIDANSTSALLRMILTTDSQLFWSGLPNRTPVLLLPFPPLPAAAPPQPPPHRHCTRRTNLQQQQQHCRLLRFQQRGERTSAPEPPPPGGTHIPRRLSVSPPELAHGHSNCEKFWGSRFPIEHMQPPSKARTM